MSLLPANRQALADMSGLGAALGNSLGTTPASGLWSDVKSSLGAIKSVASSGASWTAAVSLFDNLKPVGQLVGDVAQAAEGTVAAIAAPLTALGSNKPVGAIQRCQCPPGGSGLDISPNDLVNFAGAVVNLPVAILLCVIAKAVPGFGDTLMDNVYSKFGTGDHKGRLGFLVGDASRYADPTNEALAVVPDNDRRHHTDLNGQEEPKNDSDDQNDRTPGVLGVAMGLAHLEGIWGDSAVFEKEQYCHNIATTPGQGSKSEESAPQTAGEGVGIFAKQFGLGDLVSGWINGTDAEGHSCQPVNKTGFSYGVYIGGKAGTNQSSQCSAS